MLRSGIEKCRRPDLQVGRVRVSPELKLGPTTHGPRRMNGRTQQADQIVQDHLDRHTSQHVLEWRLVRERSKESSVDEGGQNSSCDAPPDKEPSGRNRAQRQITCLGPVRLDEHLKSAVAARAAVLDGGRRDDRRRVRIFRALEHSARRTVRDSMQVRKTRARYDALNGHASESPREVLQQRDLPLCTGGEIGLTGLGWRWNEPSIDIVKQRLTQPRTGRDERHVPPGTGVPS